jgi:hypothetical protein
MRNTIIIATAAILMVFPISCIVESKNPLSSPDNSVLDKRLPGMWKVKPADNEDNGNMLVLQKEENTLLFIIYNTELKYEQQYEAFVTTLGKNRWLNVYEPGSDPADRNYILVYYTIERKRLKLQLLDKNKLAELVENGAIEGTVTGTPKGVTLTGNSESLAAFFSNIPLPDILENDTIVMTRTR